MSSEKKHDWQSIYHDDRTRKRKAFDAVLKMNRRGGFKRLVILCAKVMGILLVIAGLGYLLITLFDGGAGTNTASAGDTSARETPATRSDFGDQAPANPPRPEKREVKEIFTAHVEKPKPSAGESNASVKAKADALLAEGREWEARNQYSVLLEMENDPAKRVKIVEDLNRLNRKLIFSATPSRDGDIYIVESGDTLSRIAKKYKIPYQLIQRLNGLKGSIIHVGQRLKTIKGPFHALVDKSDFRLTIYLNGHYVKEYPVGLGEGNSTPVGVFTVLTKLKNPAWTKSGSEMAADDPKNPLGERWIGFDLREYGIHGTIDPQSIGRMASLGCIRMLEEDVEEVYDLLVRKHSRVEIRE